MFFRIFNYSAERFVTYIQWNNKFYSDKQKYLILEVIMFVSKLQVCQDFFILVIIHIYQYKTQNNNDITHYHFVTQNSYVSFISV